MTRAEFTTEVDKEKGKEETEIRRRSAGGLRRGERFVAAAGEDGEAGIFGVGGIGGGTLAKEERRAFCRFDGAGVEAGGTKACGRFLPS